MVIGTYITAPKIPRLSTGVIALDKALGGGIVLGIMTELYGKPGCGKSTMALSIMAQAQKQFPEKHVVYLDTEKALSVEWAEKNGVRLETFEHVQPDTAEQAFDIMEQLLKTGNVSVVVLDSVPASIPGVALEDGKEIGEANIGAQARIIAQALPRLMSTIRQLEDRKVAIILINQRRANLQARQSFNSESIKTTGGYALPHYTRTRLGFARIEGLKNKDKQEIGQRVQVHLFKHSFSPGPGAKVEFNITAASGVDVVQELLEYAKADGSITLAGAWYKFATGEKVLGEEACKDIIKEKYFTKMLEFYKNENTTTQKD